MNGKVLDVYRLHRLVIIARKGIVEVIKKKLWMTIARLLDGSLSLLRSPIMDGRILDLYRLYKLVISRRGMVKVIKMKLWREIARCLGLSLFLTNSSTTLRNKYVCKL